MNKASMLCCSTARLSLVAALALATAGCVSYVKEDNASTTFAGAMAGDTGASPTLGARPPAGDDSVVVLFDGTTWSGWVDRNGERSRWLIQGDGSARVNGGDAVSEEEFQDFQLHVEFLCPVMPEKEGQARANSGVYLHGRYEVQVLDTFGQDPAMGSCGALYGIAPPMVNASRPAGQWQTYDINFRAPRLDDAGHMTEAGGLTVMHNGIVIHNNLVIESTTPGGLDGEMVVRGPFLLQDHSDPVRYRNIWARKLAAE